MFSGDKRLKHNKPLPKGEGTPIVARCCVVGCEARLEWYKNLGRGEWNYILLPGAAQRWEAMRGASFYCPSHHEEWKAAQAEAGIEDAPEEKGWLD